MSHILYTLHFGAVTVLMKIDGLLSLHNAHRKVIDKQLLKIEIAKQDEMLCEFDTILSGITAKLDSSNHKEEESGADRFHRIR